MEFIPANIHYFLLLKNVHYKIKMFSLYVPSLSIQAVVLCSVPFSLASFS